MEDIIENKIEKSGLITLDLQDYYPKGERVLFDITPYLWNGFVLKEKDFRAFVAEHDWSLYKDKFIAIYNTSEAIVPSWAYMLLASNLQNHVSDYIYGNLETLESTINTKSILEKVNPIDFQDKRVLIKGCGDIDIPNSAYLDLFKLLKPYCKSIMFGEACSSVPVYKKK